ncbi:MAG: hypothetical protein R3270_11700 [Gammaproteobacteria bacterium]|nr:hypothetical protein [Gammaproteobacteria bacterium]
MSSRLHSLTFPVALGIAVVVSYLSGMGPGFLLDDFNNIVDDAGVRGFASGVIGLIELLLDDEGGLVWRPLAFLSFGMTAKIAGLDATAFRIVNLAVHVANTLIVFFLARKLLNLLASEPGKHGVLAFLVAAFWGLHPLHVSTVLYPVQLMTLAASSFLLLGMLFYIEWRKALSRGIARPLELLLAAVMMLLALGFKEIGFLLPAYLVAIEIGVFQARLDDPAGTQRWRRLLWSLAIIGTSLAAVYLVSRNWMAGFDNREFTLLERLLTEARVTWGYVEQVFLPNVQAMGLLRDDIPISRGLLTPPTTVVAILSWFAAIGLAFRFRHSRPWWWFGVLFFGASQAIESTIVPLEIYFEHRVYVGSLGLVLAAIIEAHLFASRRLPRPGRYIISALLLGCFVFALAVRAWTWNPASVMLMFEFMHHPDSSRANNEYGLVLAGAARDARIEGETGKADRLRDLAIERFRSASALSSWRVQGLVNQLVLDPPLAPQARFAVEAELIERLANPPYHQTYEQAVRSLMFCVSAGSCSTPLERMSQILAAVLENPQLPGNLEPYFSYEMWFFQTYDENRQADALARLKDLAQRKNLPTSWLLDLAERSIQLDREMLAIEFLGIASSRGIAPDQRSRHARLSAELGEGNE